MATTLRREVERALRLLQNSLEDARSCRDAEAEPGKTYHMGRARALSFCIELLQEALAADDSAGDAK